MHLQIIFTPNETTGQEFVIPSHLTNNFFKPIKKVTLKELKYELKFNMSAKKAPGYDLITGQVLKMLPTKGLRMLLILINTSFRLMYIPAPWKMAEMMMILKPGKEETNTVWISSKTLYNRTSTSSS